jgi:ribosomal protein S18
MQINEKGIVMITLMGIQQINYWDFDEVRKYIQERYKEALVR